MLCLHVTEKLGQIQAGKSAYANKHYNSFLLTNVQTQNMSHESHCQVHNLHSWSIYKLYQTCIPGNTSNNMQ